MAVVSKALDSNPQTSTVCKQYPMAAMRGIVRCATCHKVLQMPSLQRGQSAVCPRCHSQLHFRYPRSLSRTWAWLLTAFVLFFPANLLPVMTVMYFGDGQPDTIMSGVLHLLEEGQYSGICGEYLCPPIENDRHCVFTADCSASGSPK